MLRLHPESNLKDSIPILGLEVIDLLKKKHSFVLVESIIKHFLRKKSDLDPRVLFDAFTFLYSLKIIEYRGYKIRLNNGQTN